MYRHAFGAVLLLFWRWSAALADRVYGHPASRLLAALNGERQPARTLEMTCVRARIWLFQQAARLLPPGYWE